MADQRQDERLMAEEELVRELVGLEEGYEVLTRGQMRENAFHESGHAVIGLSLGIGPLGSGIKLWPRRIRHGPNSGFKFGQVRMCIWTESDAVVREEIERSIMAVLAGQLAQHRLTPAFQSDGWAAHPSAYVADLKLVRWQGDDRLIGRLLQHLPLNDGQSSASALVSLTDRTQRLLDNTWPGVQAVARAVLRARHYSLSGKQVAGLVNDVMHSKYRPVNRCHDVKS